MALRKANPGATQDLRAEKLTQHQWCISYSATRPGTGRRRLVMLAGSEFDPCYVTENSIRLALEKHSSGHSKKTSADPLAGKSILATAERLSVLKTLK